MHARPGILAEKASPQLSQVSRSVGEHSERLSLRGRRRRRLLLRLVLGC